MHSSVLPTKCIVYVVVSVCLFAYLEREVASLKQGHQETTRIAPCDVTWTGVVQVVRENTATRLILFLYFHRRFAASDIQTHYVMMYYVAGSINNSEISVHYLGVLGKHVNQVNTDEKHLFRSKLFHSPLRLLCLFLTLVKCQFS